MSPGRLILPEIVLFILVLTAVFFDAIYKNKKTRLPFFITITGLLPVFFAMAFAAPSGEHLIFSGTLLIDPVTQYIKAILTFTALVASVCAYSSVEIRERERTDFIALVLIATLGGCVAVSAMSLITLFLAMELSALSISFLVIFTGRKFSSSDAAIKQLIFNAATSVLMVIGVILVFSFTKTLDIQMIGQMLKSGPLVSPYFALVLGLVTVGMIFRMSLFPFHTLTPGVMAGAPTPSALVHGVLSGLIGFGVLLRILFLVFSVKTESLQWESLPGLDWRVVLGIMSAATMTLASLMAIQEENLKKILSFSLISQLAFIASGLSVQSTEGIMASLFSAAAFVPALLGAYIIVMICLDGARASSIDSVRGLVWTNPFEGVALCVFLLSLAAIPGTVGFPGRFYVLSALLSEGNYWLAIVGIVNTVFAAVYYFGLLSRIFEFKDFNTYRKSETRFSTEVKLTVCMMLLPTVLLGIYWDGLVQYISNSLVRILW